PAAGGRRLPANAGVQGLGGPGDAQGGRPAPLPPGSRDGSRILAGGGRRLPSHAQRRPEPDLSRQADRAAKRRSQAEKGPRTSQEGRGQARGQAGPATEAGVRGAQGPVQGSRPTGAAARKETGPGRERQPGAVVGPAGKQGYREVGKERGVAIRQRRRPEGR